MMGSTSPSSSSSSGDEPKNRNFDAETGTKNAKLNYQRARKSKNGSFVGEEEISRNFSS